MTDVAIRPYRPADHAAGRRLWAELAERHHELYADANSADANPVSGDTVPAFDDVGPVPGGDPGAGFEEYLTRLDLAGVWVAESGAGAVVGLVGLLVDGRGGRVEPVVVRRSDRGQGIGRALLGHVADEARRRGLARLTVTPAARNIEALRCLRAAGYDVLSALELTADLRGRPANREELEIRGVQYRI